MPKMASLLSLIKQCSALSKEIAHCTYMEFGHFADFQQVLYHCITMFIIINSSSSIIDEEAAAAEIKSASCFADFGLAASSCGQFPSLHLHLYCVYWSSTLCSIGSIICYF